MTFEDLLLFLSISSAFQINTDRNSPTWESHIRKKKKKKSKSESKTLKAFLKVIHNT